MKAVGENARPEGPQFEKKGRSLRPNGKKIETEG